MLYVFHEKYEMLASSSLRIWDKEEQDGSMASEVVNTEYFLFKTIKEYLNILQHCLMTYAYN